MPVKFWQTIVGFWFFLSYLISTTVLFIFFTRSNNNLPNYELEILNFHKLFNQSDCLSQKRNIKNKQKQLVKLVKPVKIVVIV